MTQGPYDEIPPDATPVPDAEPPTAPVLPPAPPPVPLDVPLDVPPVPLDVPLDVPPVPLEVPSAPVGWPSASPPFTRSEVPAPEPADPTPAEPVVPPVLTEPAVPEVTEDDPEDDPEDEAEDDVEYGAEEAQAVQGSRSLLLPVLAALAVVLAGLTGFLGWTAQQSAGPAPVEASRAQALTAAREAARLVFSYDYRRLDKDFAAGKAVTTGEFAKEYARTTAKLVDDVAPRYKAVVSADVSEASVVRASESTVVCLVFVNQSSTSSLMPQPKVTQSRLEMTLTRTGGRWLVSSIDAL